MLTIALSLLIVLIISDAITTYLAWRHNQNILEYLSAIGEMIGETLDKDNHQ